MERRPTLKLMRNHTIVNKNYSYIRNLISKKDKIKKAFGLAGLINLGNTCFMNTTV